MLKHPRVKALGEIGKDNNVVILFSSWVSEINKIWKSRCGYFAQCDVTALVTLHLYALATGYESNHWVCKHSIIRCLSSETVLVLNMVLSDCLLNQPERIIVVQLTFFTKNECYIPLERSFCDLFWFYRKRENARLQRQDSRLQHRPRSSLKSSRLQHRPRSSLKSNRLQHRPRSSLKSSRLQHWPRSSLKSSR